MSYRQATRAFACLTVICGALLAPVAGASASDRSIKRVIKSYSAKLDISEGHVLSALGEFKTTQNAAPVETALDEAVTVLRSLKSAIAAQHASSKRVKHGKAKFEKGLSSVVVAYEHLESAFNLKAASPQAADEQAEEADASIKKAHVQLSEGAKLLR